MRRATLRLSCFACLGASAAAVAAEKNPHVWKSDVRSVAVFKSGMGFFVREGSVELRDGWCVSEAVPPALFGTFATYSLDADATVDVVGSGPGDTVEFDGRDGPADDGGKRQRLDACRHLTVVLTSEKDDKTTTARGEVTDVTDQLVILKQNEQLAAVRLGELKRLQIVEYPLRVHVEGAKKETPQARLGMAYLRKGITWIPEYTLRILDDNTAELTLRATLVNEVEDLVKTDVHFVVGVPSFVHSEYLTPIAVGQAIRTVAAALPQGFNSQIISNAIMNRAAVAEDARATQPAPGPSGADGAAKVDSLIAGLPTLDAGAGADFAVYTKKELTIRQGEKAMVTLFRRTIHYSHFYRWNSPGALRHFLVLHNDTDTPWTTGPVIAVSHDQPLCQDAIHYTPRGGRFELPVTTAVNVATGERESEIDRQLKAHEPKHDYFLDLVTVEGRLTVRNYEKRTIELEVSRTVPGRLRSASDKGEIVQDIDRLQLLQRSGTVSWRLTLEPGASRELSYRYERYVPSQ